MFNKIFSDCSVARCFQVNRCLRYKFFLQHQDYDIQTETETLVYLNHQTRLSAGEDFIEIGPRDIFKT